MIKDADDTKREIMIMNYHHQKRIGKMPSKELLDLMARMMFKILLCLC